MTPKTAVEIGEGLSAEERKALIEAGRVWFTANPPDPELPEYMRRSYRRVVDHIHVEQWREFNDDGLYIGRQWRLSRA